MIVARASRRMSRWAVLCVLACGAAAPAVAWGGVPFLGLGVRIGAQTSSTFQMTSVPTLNRYVDNVQRRADEALERFGATRKTDKGLFDAEIPSVFEIIPTLHLGGEGFFMRVEAPLAFGESFRSAGVGLYPLGYGFSIPQVRLMPYIVLGGTASYAWVDATFKGPDYGLPVPAGAPPFPVGQSETISQDGVLVQTKIAVGAKWFVLPRFPVSLEIAYAPYALAAFWNLDRYDAFYLAPVDERLETVATKAPASAARGGAGQTLSVTAGIEWF